MKQENPAGRLNTRLWLSVTLYAGLIVLHQFLIQPALIRLMSDAPAINLAGRQRMLSQKLTKAALAWSIADDESTRRDELLELQETLNLWRTSHERLKSSILGGWHGQDTESELVRGFGEIEPHYVAMVTAAEQLLANPEPRKSKDALKRLLDNESSFLTQMHQLVGTYESEARQHVRQLQYLGLAIMVVILSVQLTIQFGLLRPEVKNVWKEWARREADYQLLVESMTDGLVVFDTRGRVEFSNSRFSSMLGRADTQLIDQPASTLIADSDREQFEQLMMNDMARPEPVDLRLIRSDGSQIETMISPRRINDSNGRLLKLLFVVTDMTNRNAVDRRSRELQIEIAHADRLKSMGAMVAALAHELNQPLGAISNYAEGCLARLSNPETDQQDLAAPLQSILKAAHRGGAVVRRTRSFVQKRPHTLAYESVDELVGEVIELCRPEARNRLVSLDVELAKDLPPVCVDGVQIQQVLANLIQNSFIALETIESSQRRITVSTRRSHHNEVELSVSDTGHGLSIESVQSLFEPFATTREHGTGLGLSISRDIVELHGGRIWYDAETGANVNSGAVFRFTLPINPLCESHDLTTNPLEAVHAG